METKILEIRDRATYFAVIAIDMNTTDPAERYHLRRVGYPLDGRPNIAIANVGAHGDPFCNDPTYWRGRTHPVAHDYIIKNWRALKSGDVVCVETILGERSEPVISERLAP